MTTGMGEADQRPGLALLPGVAMSGQIWTPLLPHLPDFQCLTPDLPGHGTAQAERWDSLEASAARILETLDGRATHLAGVSLGAYVALHMLRLAPDQFQSAVLSGIHPGGMGNRVVMKVISGVMSVLIHRPGVARRNLEMMKIPEDQRPIFMDAAAQTRPQAFRKGTNQVVDFELPGGLDRVRTQVTIAAGRNEHMLIRGGLDRIAAEFPNSGTYVAEGLGHAWPVQDPVQFADLIRRGAVGPQR